MYVNMGSGGIISSDLLVYESVTSRVSVIKLQNKVSGYTLAYKLSLYPEMHVLSPIYTLSLAFLRVI